MGAYLQFHGLSPSSSWQGVRCWIVIKSYIWLIDREDGQRHRAGETQKRDGERKGGRGKGEKLGMAFETFKAAPRDTLLPTRPHLLFLLILSKSSFPW